MSITRQRAVPLVAIPEPPARPWRQGIIVLGALAATAVALRAIDGAGIPQIRSFLLVFASLLIEALPFVLFGALVAAAMETFVPSRFFSRIAGLPRPLQMPVAGLGGFAFPVCECGSVPVARRLSMRGIAPGAAITFMLAAPILNPIVLVSTAVAYRGRDVLWLMVVGRGILGLVAALAVGWIVAKRSHRELLKVPDDHHDPDERSQGPWKRFFGQLSSDFLMLGKYLVIGGAVASALQTFLPQAVLGTVADTPVLSILAMMALAGILSLCSQSDAFVAASFVQFRPAAQLAFLVFGPMVDAKLGFLYAGTFSRGFVRTVAIGVAAVVLAAALWIEVLAG